MLLPFCSRSPFLVRIIKTPNEPLISRLTAFGLGRYLYHLPTVWVEYDAQAKAFTAQAKAKLEGIVALHYQRTLHPEAASHEDEEAASRAQDAALTTLRQQFEQLGSELYSEEWSQVRRHNVERITQGATSDGDELSAEQLQKLLAGMRQLKRKRHSARAKQRAQAAS
jgi:hypothetical protein